MIRYSYRCDKGGREQNQDSVLCVSKGDAYLFSVADGLGGYEDSALASFIVHETLNELFLEEFGEDKKGSIEDGFLESSVSICQKMLTDIKKDKNVQGSYTTLVILLISGNKARWCHVGDSRLYYLKDGHIAEKTLDHSVPQMLFKAGMIKENEIRGHPDRSKLLRAFGRDDKEVEADFSDIYEMVPGDAFLLCTDGFWEYVTENEIEDAFETFEEPEDRMTAMETSVRDAGLRARTDNYTAVCVSVDREYDHS